MVKAMKKSLNFDASHEECKDYFRNDQLVARRDHRKKSKILQRLNDEFMAEDFRLTPSDDIEVWDIVRLSPIYALKRMDVVLEVEEDSYGVYRDHINVISGVINPMLKTLKSGGSAKCNIHIPLDFLNDDLISKENDRSRKQDFSFDWHA